MTFLVSSALFDDSDSDVEDSIAINPPQFERDQIVWVCYRGSEYKECIVARLFNPDTSSWFYTLTSSQLIFPECDLTARHADAEMGVNEFDSPSALRRAIGY